MPPKQQKESETDGPQTNGAVADNGHQYQAGDTTHRKEDEWKHREPYRIHDSDEGFEVKWKGGCHCGKVKYQLSREKPLASKYCHCTTCQRLHGVSLSQCIAAVAAYVVLNSIQAPFQHATIFHKSDINFVNGIHDLGWYDPTSKTIQHHLPCKVSCAYCRTPIMDEGRNMILLFPTLIEGINTPKGRETFKPTCHMFYTSRATSFSGDGVVKWKGLDNSSDLIDDDENVIVKYEEGMKEKDIDEKKRKAIEFDKDDQVKQVKETKV